MIDIIQIDPTNKAQVEKFIRYPFNLYKGCAQWVPPFITDAKTQLNFKKHPFYEHSDAVFYLAQFDGEVVGRIALLENKPYNQYHNAKQASFYLFECNNDQEVASKLFERVFEEMKKRGLNKLVGPKGFSLFDGYGVLVEGFNHRQTMTMLNYNYDYYPRLLEAQGFGKEVDFITCYSTRDNFHMPEKVHEIARRVRERGTLSIKKFRNKKELISWAPRIGAAYRDTFTNNWEFYPVTDKELSFVINDVLMIADPRFIKIITYKEEIIAGFLFGFPDISAALQRQKGHLTPWGIADMLLEMRRTPIITVNGTGVLPEFHGRGGNALMYSELENTVWNNNQFNFFEMPQVAESAVQMRQDLINLGGIPYKNHRVYQKEI